MYHGFLRKEPFLTWQEEWPCVETPSLDWFRYWQTAANHVPVDTQKLGGRAGYRRGNPVTGLAREIGEKPRAVAFEALL